MSGACLGGGNTGFGTGGAPIGGLGANVAGCAGIGGITDGAFLGLDFGGGNTGVNTSAAGLGGGKSGTGGALGGNGFTSTLSKLLSSFGAMALPIISGTVHFSMALPILPTIALSCFLFVFSSCGT